jgi:RHS repeat-associated protein
MSVQGQSAVAYSYDNADRLTQITQGTTSVGFTYDTIDRRSTLTLPNGIVATYGYDDASQLTSLSYQKGGTSLGTLTYGYDVAGRRISMGGTLAQASLPSAVTSTVHDAANRLTSWGVRTLSYDDNGAMVTDADSSTLTYVWDERQRLSEIKQGTTTVASFQYDAFDRRIGKTIGGVTTSYLHDRWQVIQELNGTTPTANLLTGPRIDEVFRRTTSAGIEDFLIDALGSTVALTDAAGAIQMTYTYDPYGASTPNGTSSNAYQYAGRENDGGLYYYRNRYYSTGLQRFVSQDPLGLAAGQNLYAFVRGNPISFTDPLGLEETPTEEDTGMDKASQEACDIADAAAAAESAADEARRHGDWALSYRKSDEACRNWQRYYLKLKMPAPQECAPHGPIPPPKEPKLDESTPKTETPSPKVKE